jgi:hypothetical protein
MVLPELLGCESMPSRGRQALNSPSNVPLHSSNLYIYSESDPLIGFEDVEAQAQDAKEKGYKTVISTGQPHERESREVLKGNPETP